MRTEALRYIRCNLPEREKIEEKKGKIEVWFYRRPEFVFYLEDLDGFKRGDIFRDNPSLGYHKSVCNCFLDYDYEAARKWDIENAGCELSPSY